MTLENSVFVLENLENSGIFFLRRFATTPIKTEAEVLNFYLKRAISVNHMSIIFSRQY